MADLASVTATLQRENEAALAASLENASAALQSSGARAAFDELTTILDSQEESSDVGSTDSSSHSPHYTFSARFKTGSKQKVIQGKQQVLADLALDMSLASC